jgi:hypothetical protein
MLEKIEGTPALTIDGLVAKAKVVATEFPDESDHALACSIACDLVAFG